MHDVLSRNGIEFYAGVPDSLLKDLCAYIMDHVPAGNHVITANEGAAVALAVGYNLATGKTPVVYLQNSGTGNIINPLLSLADPAVYKVPILFLIGWRGEPDVPDEPQHVTQGRVMLDLMRAIEVGFDVVDSGTSDIDDIVSRAVATMTATGRSHALLFRKGTFAEYRLQADISAPFALSREDGISAVLGQLDSSDVVVSTTGMASREVFEYRERHRQGHHRDFLTVGSMGHCSQIALGVAKHRPARQVVCLDGDGALLMHMGSLAIIGMQQPAKFLHVVINNGAHDSVGGQPTAGLSIDVCAIARACNYRDSASVAVPDEIESAVRRLRGHVGPVLLEIKVRKGARKDLGRPTTTPLQNKTDFMLALQDAQ